MEEMSDTSSRRVVNGAKSKPASKRVASEGAPIKEKASKKQPRKPVSKADVNATKKIKRSTKREKDVATTMLPSTNAPSKKKRKPKPPDGSARAAFAVKEADISSEEEDDGCAREYESLPSVSLICNTLCVSSFRQMCSLFKSLTCPFFTRRLVMK
jgi:hypothetical protein